MTYEHLPRRVWGWGSELGHDSDNPTYIFNELRVGYGMPKTDTPKPEME